MASNQDLYNKLRQEYTVEEIADFAMLPLETDEQTSEQTRADFVALRMERRAQMSEEDRLLSVLLNKKYAVSD